MASEKKTEQAASLLLEEKKKKFKLQQQILHYLTVDFNVLIILFTPFSIYFSISVSAVGKGAECSYFVEKITSYEDER